MRHSLMTGWAAAWLLILLVSPGIAQDEPKEETKQTATEEKTTEEKADDTKKSDTAEKKEEEAKEADTKQDVEKKNEDAKSEEKTEKKEAEKKDAEEKKADDAKKEETAEKKEDTKELTSKAVIVNLETPTGIALQPGTGHLFVAQRFGVYRYDPSDHAVGIEIAGYPVDVYGKGPKHNIGPLGLAFLDDSHLIVGDGSRPDGEELVQVYKLGKDFPSDYIEEENADFTLGPIPAGEKTRKGEGNFYGVTVAKGRIFVTNNGDDTKGWISSAVIEDGQPKELELYIATKEKLDTDAPVAITTTPDGAQIAVGQSGEISKPKDSLLTFYDPESGELKAKYETDLHDIIGLAYSPKTKKLYAVDYAWMDTTQGGLFELTIEGDKVTTKKLASLDKPTSLAFGADGKLYVTVVGTLTEEEKKKEDYAPGKLLVFEAGL